MIRYVLVIVLTATILGMTATALDHVSTVRGEKAIQSEIASVESAAVELLEEETAVAGKATPQRVVDVELPDGSYTVARTEMLVFETDPNRNITRVSYRAGDGRIQETVLDVQIQHVRGGKLDMSDLRDSQRFILSLEADDSGKPIVTVAPVRKAHV